MPELKKSKKSCHKCLQKYKKKRKCKVCKCHSITYCGLECQREDWPRHSENCVPVMITEIPGKGVGLVASKDFKAGQLILAETPVIKSLANQGDRQGLTLTDFCEKICKMSADMKSKITKLTAKETPPGFSQDIIQMGLRENCLEEIKICIFGLGFFADVKENLFFFFNKNFVNHSCSPNASFLVLNSSSEVTAELRAIKDISKGEEVTYCFLSPFKSVKTKSQRRIMLRDIFGFDCRCCVCTGEVPDQEEILRSLDDVNPMGDPYRKTQSEWQHDASKLAVVADLAQKLYIGQPEFKFAIFFQLYLHSQFARDSVLMVKSLDMMKGLVEKTELDALKKRFSLVEESHKLWHGKIKAKTAPTMEEINHIFIFLCSQVMIK